MVDETEWPKLARYFAGECSGEEAAEVRAWIEDDAERAAEVAALRDVWEEVGRRVKVTADQDDFDPVAAWAAVLARKRAQVQARTRPPARHALTSPRRLGVAQRFWRVAAVLAVLGGGTLVWRAARPDRPAADRPLAMRDVVTTRGQRAHLTLSDGTRIVLGVDSRLRFPRQFGGGNRDVYLEYGEAYFDVEHDERPFFVHTADAIARDLGTEFSVQAYSEDTRVEVVVTEGKVALSGRAGTAGGRSAVIMPGQLGRLDRVTSHVDVRSVDPAPYLAWVQGKLVFDNTPLPLVLARLERWYDVEFLVRDSSLATRPLTASFERESIDEVLDVIAPSLDVQLRRDGRIITVTSRK